MAKKAYIGVNNIAQKTKKIYVGVNGVARKVKKGYIGVNGVARLFFSGEGKLKYYQALSSVSGKGGTEGATVGNYALFVGGDKNASGYNLTSNTVVFYNSSLTRSTKIMFFTSDSETHAMACNDETYAYISHGQYIHRIDSALTQTDGSSVLGTSHAEGTISSNGTYVLKAGDYDNPWVVSGYDCATMTRVTASALNSPSNTAGVKMNYNLQSGTIGSYIVFAGGYCNYLSFGSSGTKTGVQTSDETTAYDSSLTKSTPSVLTTPASCLGSAYNDNYLIFAGGRNYRKIGSTIYNQYALDTVNIYNTSLTKSVGDNLTTARQWVTGLQFDNYSMFCGGEDFSSNSSYTYTDIYDLSLTHTQDTATDLTTARHRAGAAVAGGYGIIYGGYKDIPETYIID